MRNKFFSLVCREIAKREQNTLVEQFSSHHSHTQFSAFWEICMHLHSWSIAMSNIKLNMILYYITKTKANFNTIIVAPSQQRNSFDG
jgi:hypothetical protein